MVSNAEYLDQCAIERATHISMCSEEVGQFGHPCEHPAVAVRRDDGGHPYPVCRKHVRELLAGFAEIRDAVRELY